MSFFRADAEGLVLTVRATPKASREAVQGLMPTTEGAALKVAVTAPADKGKANAAVCALLAKTFGVAKSNVVLMAGETDRRKVVRVMGNPVQLSEIARQWTQT